MNIYEHIASNRQTTLVILGFFILFFLFIGLGFDYYHGLESGVPFFTVIALIFGIVSSYGGYRYGDKLVLFSTRAKEVNLNDPKENQWQNVVQEMSIASGIPLPKIYIINDPDPNAFATGRNPEHASIVVTRGLLEKLNRDELQAVAAHEMSHIRNFDIRLMLVIAVLVGAIALIADWARRGLIRRDWRINRKQKGNATLIFLVIWLLTVALAPVLSQLIAMLISRKREYLADASAAELTRNPLALVMALEKIDSCVDPTRSINQGNAHLCICDPKGRRLGLQEGWRADLFATHPPINKRIAALKQMAYLR